MAPDRERWDVVCRVVDNYGDVGIAWRLACQLAADDRRDVRLVVDGLGSLATIVSAVDATRERQRIGAIDVTAWSVIERPDADVADVVVELLGCGLPDAYLDAMVSRAVVWIDFEHLSAEPWVEDFHGLPSPHPTRPLVKHFFYPGFAERTGGLLVEPAGPVADDGLLARLGIPTFPDARRLSLFAYADAPVAGLLQSLATDAHRWQVIVPHGVLATSIDAWFGTTGRVRARGSLTVVTIPFVDQDDYDRLLALCDVNLVRGEDSFVRAQRAGKPFVWHIYRQQDAAHLPKLAAFEDLYEAQLDRETAVAQRAFWQAWNDPDGDVAATTGAWVAALPALAAAAEAWLARLVSQTSAVDRLAAFVAARRVGAPSSRRSSP